MFHVFHSCLLGCVFVLSMELLLLKLLLWKKVCSVLATCVSFEDNSSLGKSVLGAQSINSVFIMVLCFQIKSRK